MSADVVAKARRSSLVSTFGVGALLPAGDDSVMICGLDEWSKGDVVSEPRLAASLGVREFRSPASGQGRRGDVPAVRFPEWAFCTNCRRLGRWGEIADRRTRLCTDCAASISPSRFVACCIDGHIEDFPYQAWAHEDPTAGGAGHALRLIAQGHTSALSDLVVGCSCGASRSLEGAFDVKAFRGLRRCSGSRPWLLGAGSGTCEQALRTLQRGSSNVWFAVTRSSISIPSVTDRAARFVERKFHDADPDTPAEDLARAFKPPSGCTKEDVRDAIIRMRNPALSPQRPSERELRAEEYKALVNGSTDKEFADQFLCEQVDISVAGMPELIAQVSRVGRLREVRALTGFTRILPSSAENAGDIAPLVEQGEPEWLPAIEVLGEGIFVRLREDLLQKWTASRFAVDRELLMLRAVEASRGGGAPVDTTRMSQRSVALHSLAHVMVDELSLTGGYPAASLRERIYDDGEQSGILVYTASADSAGSLGGLAAQSDPRRFASMLASGIRRARWCTADPVCIESVSSGVDGKNLAACHACLLLPETSCERFNLTLDRAGLVGLPGRPDAGLFGAHFD